MINYPDYVHGIKVDYSRDELFNKSGLTRLKDGYMRDDEVSPQQRFAFVAASFGTDLAHAQRLYDYASKMWLSFSTPILSYGKTDKSLPISCYAGYLGDTIRNILDTSSETRMMAVVGGGVGLHVGLRPGDKKSSGVIPHLKTYDMDTLAFKQGTCYADNVEVLTNKGWMLFKNAMKESDIKVLQIGQDGSSDFIEPEWVEQEYSGELIRFYNSKNIDIMVTPNHRMYYATVGGFNNFEIESAEKLEMNEWKYLPIVYNYSLDGKDLTCSLISCNHINKECVEYIGKVYCAVVPKGGLLVRSNGYMMICGNTRRGATAAYLDINHPEIIEFLEMRKPTGGDPNRKCLNLHHGVNITDDFMQRIEKLSNKDLNLTLKEKEELDRFPLINKHTGKVVEYVSAKELWSRILTIRMETGEPYIWFIDAANRGLPEYQKALGLKNHGSNLCLTGDTLVNVIVGDDENAQQIHLDELVERFNSSLNEEIKILSGKEREYNDILDVAKTGTTKELIEIKDLLDGNIIRCTPDHEIMSGKRGFVKAKYLNENYDTVYLSNGRVASFTMRTIMLDEEIPVYDVTVDKNHSFFANNILVHNCSEISLATDENRTFVCCLSSVNCEKYDEWKDNSMFIPDVVEMLDNVIETFINKASKYPELKRAVYSATRERAIGIGMMGWHAYLQSKMIPFESPMAVSLNKRIWSKINKEAKDATSKLAIARGPCPDSIGSDDVVRNSHLLVSMPTASSSFLMNTSPSIEPYRANVYLEKGVNGTITHRNRFLEKLLEEKGKNTQEVWSDIIANDGSVQQLDFLSDYEKEVFKTAIELDQAWLVQHAADRQEYICQAQSLNLFFHPESSIEYLHLIHLMAWKTGLKGLYYCRSDTLRKADKVGKSVERERIEVMNKLVHQEEDICLACQ